MSVDATVTLKCSCSGWVQSGAKAHSGDSWTHTEASIGASDTDTQVDVTIDVSQIKSLFIYSPDSDLLLETNNAASGSCDDSITIKEDIPLVWDSTSGYYTCPLGTDVTTIYVTNSGGVATTLYIGLCRDATP